MDYEVLTDFRRLKGRTIKSIDYNHPDDSRQQLWKITTHDKKVFLFKPVTGEQFQNNNTYIEFYSE